jgi:prepilin-type N-terminal cleavage/methylation domain-containing protein
MNPFSLNKNRGFSLIELLIAISLFGIGVMAISVFLPVGSAHVNKARLNSIALALSQQKMEELKQVPFTSPDLTAGAHAESTGVFQVAWTVEDSIPNSRCKRTSINTTWTVSGDNHTVQLITFLVR